MSQRTDSEWLHRCINLGMVYFVNSFQIDELFVLIDAGNLEDAALLNFMCLVSDVFFGVSSWKTFSSCKLTVISYVFAK